MVISVNLFTPRTEVYPTADKTSETAAATFVNVWIAWFGIASTVSTYHRQQFESTVWRQLMELLRVKRIQSTSYLCITNDLVEHFHR